MTIATTRAPARTRTLHMIGNAHIDPVWLWRWQEGLQEVKATFRSALDRMSERPDFVFTASSAAFYEWVEQNDPAMFREIQRRVAEGRWAVVGGWWIEPDCNLPGGESFVRQALCSQRYFQRVFGRIATVAWNPDAFGHAGSLPQILRKSGLERYVFMRPQVHEKTLPAPLFWWGSPDGSRILAFRILYEYCAPPRDIERHIRKCADVFGDEHDDLMCLYGVGNHGGGPTKANLAQIERLDADGGLPRLALGRPEDYFDAVAPRADRAPVIVDELQRHASGCYAATSKVKAWNRRAEHLLASAEKWSAVAERMTGLAYPGAELERAWKNVLFGQFHDILAGTAIEAGYEDARDTYGEAMAIASRAINAATQSLAWRIDIPQEEGMKPLVVFNPHAWSSAVPVEAEYGGIDEGARLVDESGSAVPIQMIQALHTAGPWRKRFVFVGDLPPAGYRVYRVLPAAGAAAPAASAAAGLGASVAENERFRLRVDAATGGIAELHDKSVGASVFAGVGARPVVVDDPSDTWGHDVERFDREIGGFEGRSVRVIESGPVRTRIRTEAAYGSSLIAQEYTLYSGLERVDVTVTVDWRERAKLLKLRFPVNVRFPQATYETPYGFIHRPSLGTEEPGQRWIDVTGVRDPSGETYGLAILNDRTYSFDTRIADIGVTVLRSQIYAHHDPHRPSPDGTYAWTDQGLQTFRYVLLPHRGPWTAAELTRRAAELNEPPVALFETYHAGPLEQRASFAEVAPANVVVGALKRAEDGDGVVVRVHETAGLAVTARVDLPLLGRSFETALGPTEIRTFVVTWDGEVVETDLLERQLRP